MFEQLNLLRLVHTWQPINVFSVLSAYTLSPAS